MAYVCWGLVVQYVCGDNTPLTRMPQMREETKHQQFLLQQAGVQPLAAPGSSGHDGGHGAGAGAGRGHGHGNGSRNGSSAAPMRRSAAVTARATAKQVCWCRWLWPWWVLGWLSPLCLRAMWGCLVGCGGGWPCRKGNEAVHQGAQAGAPAPCWAMRVLPGL